MGFIKNLSRARRAYGKRNDGSFSLGNCRENAHVPSGSISMSQLPDHYTDTSRFVYPLSTNGASLWAKYYNNNTFWVKVNGKILAHKANADTKQWITTENGKKVIYSFTEPHITRRSQQQWSLVRETSIDKEYPM